MRKMIRKKGAIIALLLSIIICTSGCARIVVDVDLKSNKKADLSLLYAYMDGMGDDSSLLSESEIAEVEEEGWEYATYNKDGYSGYTLKRKNVDISELKSSLNELEDEVGEDGEFFDIHREGLRYVVKCRLFDDGDLADMSTYKSYFNMYGGYIKFVLHLPRKAISSNATKVSDDGKTLTWDYLEMESGQSISAEYSIVSPIILIMALIAILLLIIFIVTLVIVKKKKNVKKWME